MVVMLHLWNERVPPLSADGPDLLWAAKMRRRLVYSLERLAALVATDPQLAEVRAVGGVTVLISLEGGGSTRLMERLGFDVMAHPAGCLGRFGEFWENLYAWALMWAFNAPALQRKRLLGLRRAEIWMSRRRLLDGYWKAPPSM